MTTLVDAMQRAQVILARDILASLEKGRAADQESMITSIFMVCLAFITSPLVVVFIKVIIADIQR